MLVVVFCEGWGWCCGSFVVVKVVVEIFVLINKFVVIECVVMNIVNFIVFIFKGFVESFGVLFGLVCFEIVCVMEVELVV